MQQSTASELRRLRATAVGLSSRFPKAAVTDTVAGHVVNVLKQWGVNTVFDESGDGIDGLVESFRKARRHPLRPSASRGERCARLPRLCEVHGSLLGLTIGPHAAQEFRFSASPFGVADRAIDKLTGHHGRGPKPDSDERKKKE